MENSENIDYRNDVSYFSGNKSQIDTQQFFKSNDPENAHKISQSNSSISNTSESNITESTTSKGYGSLEQNPIANLPNFPVEIIGEQGGYHSGISSLKDNHFQNSENDDRFFFNQIPNSFHSNNDAQNMDILSKSNTNMYPMSIDHRYGNLGSVQAFGIKQDSYINNKDQSKVKRTPRPPNAFIIYRKEIQADVIKSNPGVSNKEISCIIGKMWKAAPQSIKDEYKEKADQEKIDHKKKFPDYKYQPRKSKKAIKMDNDGITNIADRKSYEINSNRRFLFPSNSKSFEGHEMASDIILNQNPTHIKEYIKTSRQLQQPEPNKILNYQNDYSQPQFNSQVSSFSNLGLSTSPYMDGYRNQLGISIEGQNYQQNAFISPPTSNKSLLQYNSGGFVQAMNGDGLDFDAFACPSESDYVSSMLNKNIAGLPRLYQQNDNVSDLQFSQLQNNTYKYSHENGNKLISQITNGRHEVSNQYSRLPEIGAFISNSTDAFAQINNSYRQNAIPSNGNRGYEQYSDSNEFNQTQEGIMYSQNSVFSIPIVSDLQRKM
ncbi:Silenced mating-type M-specific polypeptide Mc [Smittium mucronatum]|uniref:Silenced mating-type M-specific polypeptide Mc n=1 Tax=Smittium mucronatum TaxID=133383 RepID=A0A1R0H1D6_9FUNG|nr:Silenced mating-type M-specific polypeptide Mc [Smittium mucronatum]